MRGNFYLTGDRGRMDSDGYFWFVGRADDVIITSGSVRLPCWEVTLGRGERSSGGVVTRGPLSPSRYRIGPFEVENALMEHPAVVETAVVSSPDPLRGEVRPMPRLTWRLRVFTFCPLDHSKASCNSCEAHVWPRCARGFDFTKALCPRGDALGS